MQNQSIVKEWLLLHNNDMQTT